MTSRILNRPIAVTALVIFLAYTGQFIAYPIIPLLTLEKGGGPIDVGLVLFTNLMLAGFLAVPMGSLSDKIGRKPVIMLGVFAGATGHLLIPFASNPIEILGAFAIAGIGRAAYGPAAGAMMGDLANKNNLATSFSWASVGRQTGHFVGPALGGFVASFYGLSSAFAFCGLFLLVSAGTALLALSSQKTTSSRGDEKGITSTSTRGEIFAAVRNVAMIAVLTGTFASTFGLQGYRSFIPLFVTDIGADAFFVGILFSVQAVASVLARIPVARYSDKTGKRSRFVMIGLILKGVSLGFAIMVPNLAIILLWGFMLGFGTAVAGGSNMAIIGERTKKESRGAILGIHSTTIYLSQGLGSIVTGFMIASFGFEVGFEFLGIVLALSTVTFYLLSRRAKIK